MSKYRAIYEDLKNEILNGKFKGVQKIPDEKKLCNHYSVSKLTIKKAVDLLVEDGIVFKKQGSGTYVNVNRFANSLLTTENLTSPTSFTHQNENDHVTSKILDFNIIKANNYIANSLMIDEDDFVYRVQRVRYRNEVAESIDEVYMPIKVISGLDKEVLTGSIFDFITNKCHLKPKSFHKYIYSRPSNDLEMKELLLHKNEPVSVIEQVAFLDTGTIYEYAILAYRFDKFKYKTIVNI